MGNILLYIIFSAYIFFYEFASRYTIKKIQSADDADLACQYRKNFTNKAIVISLITVVAATASIITFHESISQPSMAFLMGIMSSFSGYAIIKGLPVSCKRPYDITDSHFILYLRGFAYDNYSATEKELNKNVKDYITFSEGHFMFILQQYLPVYTVGMTKELHSPLGAKRIYLNDNEWQNDIQDLIERATLVVILLNDSSSCILEIEKCVPYKNKTVFISDNDYKLIGIRRELNRLHIHTFPLGIKEKTIAYKPAFDNRYKIIEYQNNENNYAQAIRTIMFDIFGAKKQILTRKKFRMVTSITTIMLITAIMLTTFIGYASLIFIIPLFVLPFISVFIFLNKTIELNKLETDTSRAEPLEPF